MPFDTKRRQYRDFSATSFKPSVRESAEENEEKDYTVRGYFCTFDDPYPLFPDLFETIDPHAFDECDMSDVILQMNHDGFVYSRTRNGSLKISFDEHGGYCEADLSGSKQGREDLYEAISNGLIDRMSFGFTIADDGFEWVEDDDGVVHTRITKIPKLYDVSAIAGFPANEGTDISARSYVDAAIEARRKMEEAEAERIEREQAEQAKELARMVSRRRRRAKALSMLEIR